MVTANRAFTALPLIAACVASACAAEVDYGERGGSESPAPDRVDSTSAPLVTVGSDKLWPKGHVPFCFHSSMPPEWKTEVRELLTEMDNILPVSLEEITCPTSIQPYILISKASGSGGVVGESSGTGRSPFGQSIALVSAPSKRIVHHEMLHALGMFHEQERSDRDLHVNIRTECVSSDQRDQYTIQAGAKTSGVYDYDSLMHYPTGMFCISNPPASCMVPNSSGGSDCATVMRKNGKRILPTGWMSREDINSVYHLYSQPFPAPDIVDGAGSSVAVGDFDGDRYADLAVGLPNKTVNGVRTAGEVRIYKGTSQGLYPWKTITQADVGWATHEGDRFGWSLAAANVDDRRRTAELIIGAPFHDTDGVQDAGAVAVLRADDDDQLQPWRTYTQKTQGADVVRAGARFGYSVAAGRIARPLTATGTPELGWGLTLAIGAPGTDSFRGAVFLYAQLGETATRWTHKIPGSTAGGAFGIAVAVGSLETEDRGDLVVGTPDANSDHGKVDIFFARPPAVFTDRSAPMVSHKQTIHPPDADARAFGESLAIGKLRGDVSTGGDAINIVIGAPRTADYRGAVYVYQQEAFTDDPDSFNHVQTLLQSGTREAFDEFGYALAVANVDPSTAREELIVGAPGDNTYEGSISVFRSASGTNPLHLLQRLRQSDVPSQTNRVNDRFGHALAAGSINGVGDTGVTSDDFDNNLDDHIADVVVGSPGTTSQGALLFLGERSVGLEGFKKY